MAPILHMVPGSPACSAVLLVAEALGLQLEKKHLDFSKQEHRTPAFLEMNPQHTVPTLNDDGFIIWDSHAINSYLVDKYGKNDSLYPKDLQKRATVNQRLHYDNGVLFPTLGKTLGAVFSGKSKVIGAESVEEIHNVYALLNTFLERSQFIAGDHLTIADLSIVTSLSVSDAFIPVDSQKFPKLTAWFETLKKLPYYSINEEGLSRARERAAGVTLSTE